jgi:hypothetical protein
MVGRYPAPDFEMAIRIFKNIYRYNNLYPNNYTAMKPQIQHASNIS